MTHQNTPNAAASHRSRQLAVRRQLNAMAGEQGRDVADMMAEALNLLSVKYSRTELVPR